MKFEVVYKLQKKLVIWVLIPRDFDVIFLVTHISSLFLYETLPNKVETNVKIVYNIFFTLTCVYGVVFSNFRAKTVHKS